MFTCCLIITVVRTAVFDNATSCMFYFVITSVNVTSKCIVTGELLNMEKGLSSFFLNDTHLSFNFTTVYYKLCFNGAGVLINPVWSLWQPLSSPLLVFHIIYLSVTWLSGLVTTYASSDFRYLQITDTDSTIKLPLLCTEMCICALSPRCLFSIFLEEDPKKL